MASQSLLARIAAGGGAGPSGGDMLAQAQATSLTRENQNYTRDQRALQEQARMLTGQALQGDQAALSGLASVDPKSYSSITTSNEAKEKEERERAFAAASMGLIDLAQAEEADRPAIYSHYRTGLQQMFPTKFGGMPEQYDPNFIAAQAPVLLAQAPDQVRTFVGERMYPKPKEVTLGDQYRTVGNSLLDLNDPTKPVYTDPQRAPAQSPDRELVQVMGDDGRIVWQPRAGAAGMAAPPKTGAFAVTLPDGTQVGYGDVTGNKPATNAAIERKVGAENAIARLDEIESRFKPDQLRVPARVENYVSTAQDYLGMPISAAATTQLDESSQMKATLVENLALFVKDISGAAATDNERKNLRSAQPDKNDSPVVLQAKLKRARAAAESIVARENQRLRQQPGGNPPPGAPPLRNVTVDY